MENTQYLSEILYNIQLSKKFFSKYLLSCNFQLLLFFTVWCGVFGRKEIVGALKTMSILCLTSSYYFLELYWTGSQCGENNPFLQFWIYLIYVIFVFDLCTPIYSLCTWVSFFFFFFFNINKSLLLTKKKKKICYKIWCFGGENHSQFCFLDLYIFA